MQTSEDVQAPLLCAGSFPNSHRARITLWYRAHYPTWYVHTTTQLGIYMYMYTCFWDHVKYFLYVNHAGKRELNFDSMEAFQGWKEREEENTYSMYVKDQRPYQPSCIEGKVLITCTPCTFTVHVHCDYARSNQQTLLYMLSRWKVRAE